MGESNTLLYVIAAFVILHFIAGIVYLVYKIGTAEPSTALAVKEELEEATTSQVEAAAK